MTLRQIAAVYAVDETTSKCLRALTRELEGLHVAESDVISIQTEMDDGGVTAWAFYWTG